MTDHVGFAGTGLMGHGMAKNILAAGYPLAVVAHRSRAPIDPGLTPHRYADRISVGGSVPYEYLRITPCH